MVTNIIQIGNSKGIILPSEILKQLRLSLKSTVSVSLDGNQLPFFKPAGKLIFFEKKALLDWVRGAKSLSEEEIRAEAAARLNDMNNRP